MYKGRGGRGGDVYLRITLLTFAPTVKHPKSYLVYNSTSTEHSLQDQDKLFSFLYLALYYVHVLTNNCISWHTPTCSSPWQFTITKVLKGSRYNTNFLTVLAFAFAIAMLKLQLLDTLYKWDTTYTESWRLGYIFLKKEKQYDIHFLNTLPIVVWLRFSSY